jgi:CBS domain-containing protein
MKRVSHVLARKGNKMISVSPATTVIDALKIMAESNIGSVLIMQGSDYLGLMTERDYSRKVVLLGRSSTDTIVTDIMTTNLPRVSPTDSIEHCMQLLTAENVRYLPVFEGDNIVGIISINDVVKETILSQQETISNLQEYLYANS